MDLLLTTKRTCCAPIQIRADGDPFSKVAALLKAHWEGPCWGQEPKTAKQIKNLGFFCNLTSLLARTPDSGDATKVNVEIRAFLQSNMMSRTGLNKLLPTKHGFLSGDWDRCVGGLSGHVGFEACMQAIGVWMPLLQIGSGFRPNNHARKNGKAAKKLCHYHQFKISYVHISYILLHKCAPKRYAVTDSNFTGASLSFVCFGTKCNIMA